MLGAGHTSLSLLRFCSSGCIDMRAAHTVNRPTDWVLVGFHRSAGLGAPCSATSLVFSPAFIATRAESERGAALGARGASRSSELRFLGIWHAPRLPPAILELLWWRRRKGTCHRHERTDLLCSSFSTGPYFVFGNLAGMRGLVMLVPAVDEVPAPRCLPPTGTRGAIMRL